MIKPQPNKIDSSPSSIIERIRRLSLAGILFIICCFVSVLLGWLTSYIDNKDTENNLSHILQIKLDYKDSLNNRDLALKDSMFEKNNEIADLQRRKQVAGVKRSVDSVNSKLTSKSFQYDNLSLKLQATQKENAELQKAFNSPILTVYPEVGDNYNPKLIFDTSDNKYVYHILFENIGKGIAKNMRIRTYILDIANGKDLKTEFELNGLFSDNYLVMKEGESNFYDVFIPKDTKPRIICFEIKYQNYFNEKSPPCRNIYLFDANYINKAIPKLTRFQKEYVEKYLIDNKLWDK